MPIKLITKVGPNILVEVTGSGAKEVIQEISFFGELHARCGGKCGLCDSENLRLSHRTFDENDYYNLTCNDCGGDYAIGQRKDGLLYPRGDKETGGWSKFQKQAKHEDGDERKSSKPAPKKQASSDDWD